MREFVVYTGLRLLLFAATFGIVIGVWLLVGDQANIFVAVIIGFVASGIGSYFLLDRQREALARHVEARAARASKAFDEMKAKEDVDETETDSATQPTAPTPQVNLPEERSGGGRID